MKMQQEMVFTSKTRTLRREPFSTSLRPSRSLLSKVSSGTSRLPNKTLFADLEKTLTTMLNSWKTMNLIGSPSCGGAIKSVSSKLETVTKNITAQSPKVK